MGFLARLVSESVAVPTTEQRAFGVEFANTTTTQDTISDERAREPSGDPAIRLAVAFNGNELEDVIRLAESKAQLQTESTG